MNRRFPAGPAPPASPAGTTSARPARASARRPRTGSSPATWWCPKPPCTNCPDSIPAEIGAAIEPLAVAVWAVQRAQVQAGHRVLITGAGPIGLLVAQVAAARGASEIVVTDVNDDRLAVAAKFGATRTMNTVATPLDLKGMDRLIECSGNTHGPSRRHPDPGAGSPGHSRRPGPPHRGRHPARLPPALRNRPCHCLPLCHAFPTAIELASSGKVDLRSIITGTYPLARCSDSPDGPGHRPHQPQNPHHLLSSPARVPLVEPVETKKPHLARLDHRRTSIQRSMEMTTAKSPTHGNRSEEGAEGGAGRPHRHHA